MVKSGCDNALASEYELIALVQPLIALSGLIAAGERFK
tara:strand:+ start:658 stop:771 length:114 start_codon:yes stop_codon:yes gene_type:complete